MIGYSEAIRAVWLLHVRGWWNRLGELGLEVGKYREGFEDFEDFLDGPRPLNDGLEALILGVTVPGVLEAAGALIKLQEKKNDLPQQT